MLLFRKILLLATGALAAATLLSGCGSDPERSPGTAPSPDATVPSVADRCLSPNAGCPCDEEASVTDCGSVKEVHDDYVTCSAGTRTCLDGSWSECTGDRLTMKSIQQTPGGGYRLAAEGAQQKCPPGFDACDPYCNLTNDTPSGLNPGPGFTSSPTGLTLTQTLMVACTSLTLTPSTSMVSMTGTSLSGLGASNVTFTLAVSPAGCIPSPFATTWTIDRFDRATITGTNNTDGQLSVVLPIAGVIKVTAYAAGRSATANITVKVNVLEKPTTDGAAAPNQAANSTQRTAFGTVSAPAATSGSTTAAWLYPYADTYFPLGLPAPVTMYSYTLGTGDSATLASAVKVSVRYPVNTTPTTADFNYSIVVEESNAVVCAATSSACNFLDPQVVLPQLAWDYLEQSARGSSFDLRVQRLRARSSGGDVLEPETTRRLYLVNGQLKGTVYYNSYTSPQGGNTGAILKISPGATSPTLAVQPSGTCSVCHSINLSGSRLITNGGYNGGSYSFDISKLYDMNTPSPSPTVLSTYTTNRFTFGAPWKDGSLYLTHAAQADPNWRAPWAASLFYRPSAPDTAIQPTGWPNNAQAVTPRFSVDGTKMAFGFSGGNSLPRSPSGTLAPAAAGTRLVAMDFSCSNPPCTGSSSGWVVSNARDLTPGVTEQVSRPTFTPDGSAVIWQRQYRSSNQYLNGWSPSHLNTVSGALAELWVSDVPSNGSTAATPVRLLALNGLTSSGATYLPQQARTLLNSASPLYTYPVDYHAMSQTTSSGSNGPSITVVGNGGWQMDLRIDIVNGGARGTATFRYSTNGGTNWSGNQTTAANVTLAGTGLTVQFPNTANYNANSSYKALVGYVGIDGTPQGGPWNVRLDIVGTGNRGTATFRFSTDGGAVWSGNLTTAARVDLGTTGLTATFASTNYESSSWQWGALAAHFHKDDAAFRILQPDNCSNQSEIADVYDYRLNYLPAFAPSNAGGKSWVVFTSRRMYGNLAHANPWDAEPGYSCYSGLVPTKKLWIAAVDSPVTPGTDPSKAAFYLPGQELAAGNSDGYWVDQACAPLNGSCEIDDDCCGGTGASPTSLCRVISTASFPPTRQCKSRSACAPSGASCSVTADCCTGLVCPSGGGLCVLEPPLVYEQQVYQREYTATCPEGTSVKWRFFEWQSTIPNTSSIDFSVQSRATAADAWKPAAPVLAATASSTTAAGVWARGAQTVDQVLVANQTPSLARLLVTMTFKPGSNGSVAPTLNGWRQIFDCVPSQ
jgi:hypothetical protein